MINIKKKYIFNIFINFFFIFVYASDKVLIITHQYNCPDFIKIQHATFKEFLSDDYEYVVFNDAPTEKMAHKIENTCINLGIHCIRVPQEIHTRPYLSRNPNDPLQRPNIRHANCVQYSLDILGFNHKGIVLVLDSDIFPIRPFHISNYMHGKDIAAFIKRAPNNVFCLCPVLCFLNMNNLPDKKSLNFNCGIVNESVTDSGGFTYYYLIEHPTLVVENINVLYSHQLFLGDRGINREADDIKYVPNAVKSAFYTNLGFNKKEIDFLLKKPDTFEFYLNNHFLHFREGTNYSSASNNFINYKTQIFNEFINSIVQP
ncbi:MAG TPA: hypothetical protein PLU71_04660 [Candidatus Dependentiae bacterium]|nr:hypothetical protein [Candidatus Dependentiae bacterium]HRQ63125.1 hypothetical protein [Candidatus Dependentiae bacterium]